MVGYPEIHLYLCEIGGICWDHVVAVQGGNLLLAYTIDRHLFRWPLGLPLGHHLIYSKLAISHVGHIQFATSHGCASSHPDRLPPFLQKSDLSGWRLDAVPAVHNLLEYVRTRHLLEQDVRLGKDFLRLISNLENLLP